MALTDRVQGILMRPRQEWQVIDGEPATVSSLYSGYIAPLAAIGPVARFIGVAIFGIAVPFAGSVRVPIVSALVQAVVSYALALAGVYVLALIVDALAPSFGGTRNPIQALKVCAYSATASWVAAVFALIPFLAILGILGLYSLYLLYLGLPVLMKVPQERALGYTIAVIVVAIVLFFVVGLIVGSLLVVTV
jgi:hypothetical protein